MRIFLILFTLVQFNAFASSAFFIEGTHSVALGKSYDWKTGHGMLMVNKRSMAKRSFTLKETDREKSWVSRYGSITFNQLGTEMPNGGVNEKGLVVEMLALDESVYSEVDERPTLNELQWIQYQLDNYESVSEVLSNLKEIRISSAFGKIHYLVCDSMRVCAVVESLSGELVTHINGNVLANNNYAQSLEHLKLFEGFGGTLPIPTDNTSLSRFVKMSEALRVFRSGQRNNVIESSFTLLNTVRHSFKEEGNTTVWNIVYDLTSKKIHFAHTLVGIKRFIEFSELDYSCLTPRKVYNIESHQGESNIAEDLIKYKKSLNQRIIQLSLKDRESELPPKTLEKLALLPETFSCQE